MNQTSFFQFAKTHNQNQHVRYILPVKNNSVQMKTLLKLFGVVLSIAFVGCQKDPSETRTTNLQKGNIVVSYDQLSLGSRIKTSDKIMQVYDIEQTNLKSAMAAPKVDLTKNYVFTLRAEVAPPVFEGNTLQATHVKIVDNMAFVTYNTKGDKYLGGLEVFDVKDIKNPKIVWQAIFRTVDMSSVDYYNNKIYLAGAVNLDADTTASKHLKRPAILEVLSLNAAHEILKVDTIIGLDSYVGTDVRATSAGIYTTSGTDGYLKVFDSNLKTILSKPLTDVRSIDVNSNNVYVLQGGGTQQTGGIVNVFNKADASFVTSYNVGGANQQEAKSKLSVSDKYIFAALNEGGVQMLNLDGSLKQAVAKPITPEGADDNNFVSNAVSLNGDLVLIANGEAGLYVGGLVASRKDSLAILGKIKFSDTASSNFVESKDSVIFVATGLGGLKILSLSIDEGLPPVIIPTKPCATLYSRIIELFPNGKDNRTIHPELFATTVSNRIVLKNESEVYITFVGENAGWRNTLGYYTYDESSPPASVNDLKKAVLFPNVSQVDGGGSLKVGDLVQIGTGKFPAGTVIGFYLVAEGWKNGMTVDGRYTDYTDFNFNLGKYKQHTIFKEKTCGDLVLTYEDIDASDPIGGDFDYNDVVFTISDSKDTTKANTSFDMTGIPEL